jgi:DNA-binding GntR family transcriptional regulator
VIPRLPLQAARPSRTGHVEKDTSKDMSQLPGTEGLFRIPKRVGLAETVADSIAGAISAGHLQPGAKISETDFSERLGVSRVPIREALRILNAQGIVTGEQNRGYRVAMFDESTVKSVLELRLMLETILLRDAVQQWRANNEMAKALDAPIEAMREAARRGDRAASLAADLAFHRAIANAAANDITRILWEAIARHVLIIFSRHEYRDDDLNAVTRQHEAFRDKIRGLIRTGGNGDDLQASLEDHLLQVSRVKGLPAGSTEGR